MGSGESVSPLTDFSTGIARTSSRARQLVLGMSTDVLWNENFVEELSYRQPCEIPVAGFAHGIISIASVGLGSAGLMASTTSFWRTTSA